LPVWCIHLHLFQQPAITPHGVKAAVSQGVFVFQDSLLGARLLPMDSHFPAGVLLSIQEAAPTQLSKGA
jgi:hypothetical protein